MDGIILIDKSKGWTSQDVCTKVRHMLKMKKVGHCGTLDPFATGLLVVLVNKATKLGQFIELFDKTYIACLKLGVKTTSGDIDGDVVETKPIPKLTKQEIIAALNSMLGKQIQVPPMYSAIKVDGKPLYKYAREGQQIERKGKEIEVFDINFINFDGESIIFQARVSKGTYMRTLGEDIAKKLNTVGHLTDLRRTKVGQYLINDACPVSQVDESKIIGFDKCLNFMPQVKVNSEKERDIRNGKQIFIDIDVNEVAVFNYNNELLAIYERVEGNMFKSMRGFF